MHKLEMLYKSEINFAIKTMWDAGYDVMIGDDWNGCKAKCCTNTFDEAIDWLWGAAQRIYPNAHCFQEGVDADPRYS